MRLKLLVMVVGILVLPLWAQNSWVHTDAVPPEKGTYLMTGTAVIDQKYVVPAADYKAEPLTKEEITKLEDARKKVDEVERSIRKAHGEYIRDGSQRTFANCRGNQTTVEIWGTFALITTLHAGLGGNPPCF